MQLKSLVRSQNSCDRLHTEKHVRTTKLSKSHNARRNDHPCNYCLVVAKNGSKIARRKLQHIQRLACLYVTGPLRTTPTLALREYIELTSPLVTKMVNASLS